MKTSNLLVLILLIQFKKNFCFDGGNLDDSNILVLNDRTHSEIIKCSLYKLTTEYLVSQYTDKSIDKIEITNGKCTNANIIIANNLIKLNLNIDNYNEAIKFIIDSNKFVDRSESKKPEAHFDNEKFTDASNRILNLKYSSIKSTNSSDYTSARRYMGWLLHAVQDFYSHSNWVEFEPNKINFKLGQTTDLGLLLDITKRGCIQCLTKSCVNEIERELIEKKILTSGYNSNEIRFKIPIGKCSHGGLNDKTAKSDSFGSGISKDTIDSGHGYLHLNAANLAQLSTYEILKDFWSLIGDYHFGNFLGFRGKSFVIVIDDKGSMQPSIEAVKKLAIDLINNYNFYAPKLFYHDLIEALKVCEPNSDIYTFTDADSKDKNLRDEAESLAKMKSVVINNIFITNGYKSNSLTNSELNDIYSKTDVYGYESLALKTGGVMVFTDNSEIKNINKLILTKQENQFNEQTLLIAKNDYFNYENKFYIDSSIDRVLVYLTSSQSEPLFELIDSSSNKVVSYVVIFNSKLTKYFYLDSPMKGFWKIKISSNFINIKITAQSKLQFKLNLFEYDTLLSHPTYIESTNYPLIGSNLTLISLLSNLNGFKIQNVSFDILSSNSTVLKSLSPTKFDYLSESYFISSHFKIPNEVFTVKLNAFLNNNEKLERFNQFMFVPTSFELKINFNESTQVDLGDEFSFEINVVNLGLISANVYVSVVDTLKLIHFNKDIVLNINQTYKELIRIKIPNDDKLNGQTDSIALGAGLVTDYLSKNQETLYLTLKSKDVLFDLSPSCFVVEDSRARDCDQICSNTREWKAKLLVNETGHGLSKISLQTFMSNDNQTIDVSYDPFGIGSNKPLEVSIKTDCCSQEFNVLITDIYENIGKCEFKKNSVKDDDKLKELENRIKKLEANTLSLNKVFQSFGSTLAQNIYDTNSLKNNLNNKIPKEELRLNLLSDKTDNYTLEIDQLISNVSNDKLVIKNGRVCHGGENNFNDDNYRGERSINKIIQFDSKFKTLPKVFVSSLRVEMDTWLADVYEINSKNINLDNFQFEFKTWKTAAIYSQCADWIAFGK